MLLTTVKEHKIQETSLWLQMSVVYKAFLVDLRNIWSLEQRPCLNLLHAS